MLSITKDEFRRLMSSKLPDFWYEIINELPQVEKNEIINDSIEEEKEKIRHKIFVDISSSYNNMLKLGYHADLILKIMFGKEEILDMTPEKLKAYQELLGEFIENERTL